MKNALTLALILLSTLTYAQQPIASEWDELSKSNKRLLPKFGNLPKSDSEKTSDEKFITETLKLEQFKGDARAASDHMINLGFNYLSRGDIKTAMYRFNQAYLLDSANSNIYWGYGAVYMTLGKVKSGKQQYEQGLSRDPTNTNLLTDYGTSFMEPYFAFKLMPANEHVKNPQQQAAAYLDSALIFLNKSYTLDRSNQNTTYKLSTSYWYKEDCENAWKYFDETIALGGRPITEAYEKDLKKKCKKGRK